MKADIAKYRDPKISDIFYYFQEHTNIANGRTAGRKIGTIQEILIRKFLLTDSRVTRSIVYEPRVQGRSHATHKVEFVFYQPLEAVSVQQGRQVRFGAIPEMLVTVERAPAASFDDYARVSISYGGKPVSQRIDMSVVHRLPDRGDRHFGLTAAFARAGVTEVCLLDMGDPLASIESKRVGAQRFAGSDKLGAGIQTIEKAKQAALVAVDFDLQFNKVLLCQTPAGGPRKYKNLVALGNGVHWTEHDLAVLETYVDHTYLVRDEAIIRYAEYVRGLASKAGKEFFSYFMAYFNGMTKTPPDSFKVTSEDFVPLRPADSRPLLDVVANQIQPFEIRG